MCASLLAEGMCWDVCVCVCVCVCACVPLARMRARACVRAADVPSEGRWRAVTSPSPVRREATCGLSTGACPGPWQSAWG